MPNDDYLKGYGDAIDDVEAAMASAVVMRFDGETLEGYNDPKLFTSELKKLHDKRFN